MESFVTLKWRQASQGREISRLFRPRFVPLGKLGQLRQQDDLSSKRKKPTPCPKTVESNVAKFIAKFLLGLGQIEIKVSIRSLESG